MDARSDEHRQLVMSMYGARYVLMTLTDEAHVGDCAQEQLQPHGLGRLLAPRQFNALSIGQLKIIPLAALRS